MATRRRRRAAPRPGLLNVNGHTEPSSGSDVLRALKVTTHAILAVWNYLLSLPNEHGYTQPRQRFRPTLLSTSEPQKKRRISSGTDRSGPLAHIRRAALDVLTLLRELEESMRLALSDDAYDALERPATQSRLRGT